MTFTKTALSAAALAAITALSACGGGNDTPAPVAVGDTVALTASGRIISFDRATPGTLVGSQFVTRLGSGESLVGIDYRPADGLLWALSNQGRLYTVDPTTGVATRRSTLIAAAGDDNPYAGLVGSVFAFDFNPAADRLRVISSSGQNLRINPADGATTTDGAIALAGGSASVSAAAYTNSFASTGTTQLYDIDFASDLLHLQDPPNAGTLQAGIPLGVDATAGEFDIDARTNTGYAALTVGSSTSLYTLNLAATGAGPAATLVGAIAGGEAIRGLALRQPVVATTAIGLTNDNRLVSFDPRSPNTLSATVAITGLAGGESVLGIDVRPADGLLWALATGGKLYTIDPASGAATARATLAADPADATAPYAGLAGNVVAVDFNPAADRLRVITDSGQSLRINVATGLTTTDGNINRAGSPATVAAGAYGNSFAGTTVTTLYDLDATTDVLARQMPPNDGTLVDVGALGVSFDAAAIDIAGGGNGLALAALRSGSTGPSTLYQVNLATGAATAYRTLAGAAAQIGGAAGPVLIDLAIR